MKNFNAIGGRFSFQRLITRYQDLRIGGSSPQDALNDICFDVGKYETKSILEELARQIRTGKLEPESSTEDSEKNEPT